MYGSKYVWMVMQGLSDTWYEDANDIECNSTQLLIASNGYFRATRSNLRNDTVRTIFNKVNDFSFLIRQDNTIQERYTHSHHGNTS